MKTKFTWLAAFLFVCCTVFATTEIKGDGNIVTKTIPVDNYDRLDIGNRIEYSKTSTFRSLFGRSKEDFSQCLYMQTMGEATLEITMDENLFNWLDIYQKDGLLKIQAQQDIKIVPSKMLIRTASNNLKDVDICGCMDFVVNTMLNVDEIRFSVSGVGDIRINDLACRKLYCDVSGVGNAYFTGKADVGVYYLSGVGKIFAYDCAVRDLKCDVSGIGRMQVMATSNLRAETSGIGSIKYRGEAIVNASSSGIGKVKRAN